MKYLENGTCDDCGIEEFGAIALEEGLFMMFSLSKRCSEPDDLVRYLLDGMNFCQNCDVTFKAIKSRIIGGVQCPHNEDRVHVTFFLYFDDPIDQLALTLNRCCAPLSAEQRLRLIEVSKVQAGNLWIGTGPFTETPEVEEADDDFNVDDLLAEIALLLSGDEPQD